MFQYHDRRARRNTHGRPQPRVARKIGLMPQHRSQLKSRETEISQQHLLQQKQIPLIQLHHRQSVQ